MFVSSFSTYITNASNDNRTKPKIQEDKTEVKKFSSTLSSLSTVKDYNDKNLPVNYISNYKSLNNQQKLQNQQKSEGEIKYKQISHTTNAKEAYESNSKIYSLVSLPKKPINQTTQITSKKYPQDIQDIQKQNKKYEMVNTYLENDKYYQITA